MDNMNENKKLIRKHELSKRRYESGKKNSECSMLKLLLYGFYSFCMTLLIGLSVIVTFRACSTKEAYGDTEVISIESEIVENLKNVENLENVDKLSISEEDAYILMKMAMAEAEGEDVKGKALVMNVILNRVKNESFPNTVYKVISQKKQFTPFRNGRYKKVEPDNGCKEALDLIKTGFDESEGALYFEMNTDKSTWHSRNLEKLFSYGCHTFYKEKS